MHAGAGPLFPLTPNLAVETRTRRDALCQSSQTHPSGVSLPYEKGESLESSESGSDIMRFMF